METRAQEMTWTGPIGHMETVQPFGSLAALTQTRGKGPMALRPRLTTGLPFRGELADSAAAWELLGSHGLRASLTVLAKP
jgi:hypothetical protein